ncbi:MAG TPA: hypothetical protein VM692_12765 [Gammaproteobacteria bacterium]|nr:hypothetical protein [Gammaproteobacteria bacterium]
MKTLFLAAIVCGFAGTLAAAHYVPFLQHERLPSHTSVVANGGRSEQFLIRLPADRIAATDSEAGGLRSTGVDGAMLLPAQFVGEPLLVEHFKIRDSADTVVGLAARHWHGSGAAATTTWSILIPSRGSLVLNAFGEPRGALESALRTNGYGAGKAWDGKVTVDMIPQGQRGSVATGTGEFAALSGSYTETWTVAAIDENGRLSGTVELNTITSLPESSVPE